MELLLILTIAAILSAGMSNLLFKAGFRTLRLPEERRLDAAFLRRVFAVAAALAGGRAAAFRSAKKKEQVKRELYSALSILRNHASAAGGEESVKGAGACVTTDYILEQFAQADGVLKEPYAGALRLLRTGRRTEAAEYFTAAADVELARDFIMLVLDWDAVPSWKLKQTVGAFQNALKETRTTELMRKNEVMSDLVYIPVVAGVLIVFVNFIYVAYFAEQRAMLAELFY